MQSDGLDPKDIEIIGLLKNIIRLTYPEIGEKVGLCLSLNSLTLQKIQSIFPNNRADGKNTSELKHSGLFSEISMCQEDISANMRWTLLSKLFSWLI